MVFPAVKAQKGLRNVEGSQVAGQTVHQRDEQITPVTRRVSFRLSSRSIPASRSFVVARADSKADGEDEDDESLAGFIGARNEDTILTSRFQLESAKDAPCHSLTGVCHLPPPPPASMTVPFPL